MELTVDKDLEEHTLTVVATFDHPVEQVWDLYADPRKMERWWGPPTYPATVVEHSLTSGGVVRYYMTGPDGEQFHGREHRDVLLDRREAHRVGVRETAHRQLAGHGAAQDVAPGRVGERVEEPIHIGLAQLRYYNHLVVD